MNSLDMLNTKYIVFNDDDKKNIYVNDDIPGSAWFVKENINVTLNLKKINEKGEWERLIQINNNKKERNNHNSSHNYGNVQKI